MHLITNENAHAFAGQDFSGRLVSLVPSLTEWLADMGLMLQLVGRTSYCVHPAGLAVSTAVVGGTKNARLEDILELAPTLVIANKEENERALIEALVEQGIPVYLTNIAHVSDLLITTLTLGSLLDADAAANQIISGWQTLMHELALSRSGRAAQRTLYMIWRKPWMAAGHDTFISHMLACCGYANVMSTARYPTLSVEEIVELNPEVVMLSSEPYPFQQKHIEEIAALLPEAKILLVNGEAFSWYGTRPLRLSDYLITMAKGV